MLKIVITFMSGNQRTIRSEIPPSVKEDTLYIKNPGNETTGGSFAPMRNIRLVEIIPIIENDKDDK